MANGFGKANLENVYEGFKYFKLLTPDPKKGQESTELVLRIFPAMHSYADSGMWKFFYGQHYGHVGNNPRNPERPRSRPFGCIQRKNKNKEILVSCPKCVQIESVREKQAKREQALTNANPTMSKDELKEVFRADPKLAELGKWLGSHNCDKKFWMNVMSLTGEFGVLQLSYKTTEEVLMPLLKRLRDEGTNALDLTDGIWLKFTRTGRRPSVTDRIEPFTEKVDIGGGRHAFVNKGAPIDDTTAEKALRILPDLKTSVVKFIDADVMQQLVNSSGDPDETDRIWPPEAPKAREAVATKAKAETVVDDDAPPAEDEEPAPVVVKTKTTVAKVEAASVDPTEAELEAKLAALRAKKSVAASAQTVAAASTDAVDDFLADFDANS